MGDSLFPLSASNEHRMGDPLDLPPLNIPKLIREFELHPNKWLGQNFLIDPTALESVVQAANISERDVVLEIGPGLGSLTRYLAVLARTVVAIEIDPNLIAPLRKVTNQYRNIEIIQGDILTLPVEKLIPSSNYLVVANIPYYITSAIIRRLLSTDNRPKRMILTVQYEVAKRICAMPGNLSLLALSVQVFGSPSLYARIPASSFYPVPKVDSAIICIDLNLEPVIPIQSLDAFFSLAQAGFSQKRKTLRNALSSGLHQKTNIVEEILLEAGIDPHRRAETINLAEWNSLTQLVINRFPEISLRKVQTR